MILALLLWACASPCTFTGPNAFEQAVVSHYRPPQCEVVSLRMRGRVKPERFSGTTLFGATLAVLEVDDSDLTETEWPGVRARGARLREVNLSRASLQGAELPEIEISESRLVEASFGGSLLDGARFEGVVLDRARFDGASMRGAQVQATSGVRATFRAADLTGARLEGVRQADLRGATLRDATLGTCESPYTGTIAAADLRGASVGVRDWSRVSLREVDLRGADLAACESEGVPALCTGVLVDEHTRLPAHLDALCVEEPPPRVRYDWENRRWSLLPAEEDEP